MRRIMEQVTNPSVHDRVLVVRLNNIYSVEKIDCITFYCIIYINLGK